MTHLESSIIYATLAGITIPLGALLACAENIRPQWLEQEFRHSVIAFGGGVLLAAVSFVLVPEGINFLPPVLAVLAVLAGGLAFLWLDRFLARQKKPRAQLVAMVSDFVPEAMALGAMFAGGDPAAPLLAFLIAIQNFPEGFNAYRELIATKHYVSKIVLRSFFAIVLLGPLAAVLGHFYLVQRPEITGAVMLFAAGGILYLIFQDIAPQARLERRWAPPLGAVTGFTLGLLGHMLVV